MSEWTKWVLWGFTNFNFELNLKVSAFYLEKQKSFIPKKNFLAVPRRYIQKMACAVSIFQKVLASIWEKAISILAGNLNSGRSYLISAVRENCNFLTPTPLYPYIIYRLSLMIVFLIYRFNLHLHWTTTIFILNLALADFLYCVVNLPLYALQYLHQRWIWGPTLCYWTAGDLGIKARICLNRI